MSPFLIIRSYFKKSRLQIFLISLMIFLAALLLGLSSVLGLDYKANFGREKDRLNAPDIILYYASVSDDAKTELEASLVGCKDISDFEIHKSFITNGTCDYGEGLMITQFSIYPSSELSDRKIDRFEVTVGDVDADGENTDEGCLIPYIFYVNGFYDVGDRFSLTLGAEEFEFVIRGFYNCLATGTPNCRDLSILLYPQSYEEVSSSNVQSGFCVSAKVSDTSAVASIEPDVISHISETVPSVVYLNSTNTIKLSSNRYIAATLFTGMIFASSFAIIAVLLSVLSVTLSNYVRENLRNLGIMKSLGYVSSRIILPIVVSLVSLALVLSALGFCASFLVFPFVNTFLESQSGIPYTLRLLPLPALISIGVMVILVGLTVLFSLLKIRQIQPIMAIRPSKGNESGAQVLPLEKTGLNINLSLGLKSVCTNIKKYVIFLVAACLIGLMLGTSGYIYEKYAKNCDRIMTLVFGNTADIMVRVGAEDETALLDYLGQQAAVKEYFFQSEGAACHEDQGRLGVTVRDETGTEKSAELCVTGAFPNSENEVSVNFVYASDNGISIGDKMVLSKDGKSAEFTVTGTFQDASFSGTNVALTREGYERLTQIYTAVYLVNLANDADKDIFCDKINEDVSGAVAINYLEYMNGCSAPYKSMMALVGIIIVILSVLVALFVLAILVNMLMFSKRREHGILKSLGFVTGEIVLQTALSFVPIAMIGSAVGLVISKFFISDFFTVFIRNIGIYSLGEPVSTGILVFAWGGFCIFSFAVVCLLALKVRTTQPHDLFNNE